MSIEYCDYCCHLIDTDYEADHFHSEEYHCKIEEQDAELLDLSDLEEWDVDGDSKKEDDLATKQLIDEGRL